MTQSDSDSRDYPARPILCASAAVFREGLVLLGARRNPPYDQIFSLPGGLVKSGESLEAAALRELAEETGVIAQIVAFNGWREIIAHDEAGCVKRHYVIVSFAARWLGGEGEVGEELSRLIWADESQTRDLPLTDGLPALLASARALIAKA